MTRLEIIRQDPELDATSNTDLINYKCPGFHIPRFPDVSRNCPMREKTGATRNEKPAFEICYDCWNVEE